MKFNFLKGKENPFSSENKRYHNNLLLFKNRIKTQNQYPVFVPKDITSEKIDKIKIKYSLNNNFNLHSRNNNKKNMFRSTSLKLVKENNLKFNNLYSTLKNERKINFGDNNKINNYIQPSKDTINSNNNNKSKFQYNFKYLKNTKEDFINVHNKLKDLWQNDAFNKKKKKFVNMVFPISKKIYLLNEIKKDIKNANKNSFGNMTITPKSTITSSSEYTNKNLFSELFSDEDNDAIMKKGGIKKPILIRNFTKPKLNLPKYRNLYNMKI